MPTGPSWWLAGKQGSLPPIAQAKVWALTVICEELDVQLSQDDIAAKVKKVGGGHPSKMAIGQLQTRFADDPEWYPGKVTENAKKRGRKVKFTPQKKRAVASSAMALKDRGQEPTVAAVVAQCPQATWNAETKAPFSDKYILEVFRTMCYDNDPASPWQHINPLHKTALSPALKCWRVKWATELRAEDHTSGYYFQHLVWVDPCSTVLAKSPRAVFDQEQGKHGAGPRWMSPDARLSSRNLRASPYANTQAHYGDKRVWWFIVLTRGKVHFEFMEDGWAQTGEGMAAFVARLPSILAKLLGRDARLPRVVASDRGPGFYQTSTGHIVAEYARALREHGFRAFAGDDASQQPPDVPDVLLHETVAGWVRKYLKKEHFNRADGLEKSQARLVDTMRACQRYINQKYDVAGLARAFPARLEELISGGGERLKH